MTMTGEGIKQDEQTMVGVQKRLQELGGCMVRAGSYQAGYGGGYSRDLYVTAAWADRTVHAVATSGDPFTREVFDYPAGPQRLPEDGEVVLEGCRDVETARKLAGRLLVLTQLHVEQGAPIGPIDLEGTELSPAAASIGN